jgi:hypothetical protein
MACSKAKLDLCVSEGASFERTFIWRVGDPPEGVDLTDFLGEVHVRGQVANKSIEILFSIENGRFIIADQTENIGQFTLKLEPEATQNLCKNGQDLVLKYDLYFKDADDNVRILIYGNFTIEATITRAWQNE